MNKKIVLHNYAEQPHEVTIEDFENVSSATLRVLTGDMVLVIEYNDDRVVEFDAEDVGNWRLASYFDGEEKIPLDKLDRLSEIKDSYEALDWLWKENRSRRTKSDE